LFYLLVVLVAMKLIISLAFLGQLTAAVELLQEFNDGKLGHHNEKQYHGASMGNSTTDHAVADDGHSSILAPLPPLPPGCNVASGRRCKMPDGLMHPSVATAAARGVFTGTRAKESIRKVAAQSSTFLASRGALFFGGSSNSTGVSIKSTGGSSSGAVAMSSSIPSGHRSTVPKTVTVAFAADDHYLPKLMAVVEQLRSMTKGKSYRLIAYDLGKDHKRGE